jgi:hypothetical protein
MQRNWSPCALLAGTKDGVVNMENGMMGSPKMERELPYDLAILLLSICPKELRAKTRTSIFTPMFRAASYTTAKGGSDSTIHP